MVHINEEAVDIRHDDLMHGTRRDEMERMEQLSFLINELKKEMPEYDYIQVPDNEKEAFNIFRALCNVRMPGPVSQKFLDVQDAMLKSITEEKGITDIDRLRPVESGSNLYLWQGDITTLRCDAIVNAANSSMLGCFRPLHGCIDNIENTFAGVQLRNYMNEQMKKMKERYGKDYEQPTAIPMISPAFNLPSKYIVHVVGPIALPHLTQEHVDQLAECYRSSLDLAAENGCTSIAFCCISTGVFGFPQDKAADTAIHTVKKWFEEHPESCMKKVIFNVFKDSDLGLYKNML
jgi:O-acetyl-ADP-ribose deacetylase (regulator of RNase III)